MALLDIESLDGALAEVRRVLRPGGSLVASIVHPFVSAFEPDSAHDRRYELAGSPYLEEWHYVDRIVRDGKSMTFTSKHRPLGTYLNALFDLGFALTALREYGDGPIPWLLAFRADLQP